MELYTQHQVKRIVNNVVAACKDITKLNKQGYRYLYLCNGFIAHYNLGGFIGHYDGGSLLNDIIDYKKYNQWNNFRQGDQNYDYYMQKKEIYNKICEALGV
jgi:hypothetical protein